MGSERRLHVLSAIVSDYVRTREPVGSRAIVERYQLGVSPATIRNDMAILEDEGYIHQPHTSAGRVPTSKGYRMFVDHAAAIKPLSQPERAAISQFLAGAVDLEDVVARTVRYLAHLTGQLAVVQYPSLQSTLLRHLELVSLSPNRLLMVIISDSGRVERTTITTPPELLIDPVVLDQLRERLNAALVGVPGASVASILSHVGEQASAAERHLLSIIEQPLIKALRPESHDRLAVAGTANLARNPDFSSVDSLLDAIEEQVVLLRLFAAHEATGEDPLQPHVSIGQEHTDDALMEASVVTTAYGAKGAQAHLGVVGSTRMDYAATMTAVGAIASYLSHYLADPGAAGG